MRLDILPRHITGFFDRIHERRSLDTATFKRACHLVARLHHGSVADFRFELHGCNFFRSTLTVPDGEFTVLGNHVYPYVGFVAADATAGATFMAFPSLDGSFAAHTEFRCLDADWLASPLDRTLLKDLASAEMLQIRHWKPRSVGEVIFNFWD